MWPFTAVYPEVKFNELLKEYDYVIVGNSFLQITLQVIDIFSVSREGGGTAGCVLANRLSASPENTVLLIERGPVADSWASRVPLLSSDFSSDGTRSQKRMSEYQPELGRSLELIHGSTLGGTSRINQMLYTRGSPSEYDEWAEGGCTGWAWKNVEPIFRKSERFLEERGGTAYHGHKGNTAFILVECPILILLLELRRVGK